MPVNQPIASYLPPPDCSLCPRLYAFREANRKLFPDKFNAPVAPFGGLDAELLIVGLAPGLRGANFTGRPFTGDYAGVLLYSTLLKYGFASGTFAARADDGLRLVNCRITNGVRCVPPENKPMPTEIRTCRQFLAKEMAAMPNVKIILSLGKISHDTVVATLGGKPSGYKFAHGAEHAIGGRMLIDSYHCSRYNTQTRRLTEGMFHAVFDQIAARCTAA